MKKTVTGAQLLVETLERINVETVFGIPGVHNLKIYDALTKSKIHHITTRNESGAGFMADGYGRRTGKPGTAIVITGPGLTNIMTPMGQAYLDAVPMVVISSQLPTTIMNQSTGFLHELKNSTIMASSVAKESRTVPSVELIENYVVEAYKLAVTGRPGPVHIEIPLDLLAEKVQVNKELKIQFTETTTLHEGSIDQAAEIINQADRVSVIAGGGAVDASKEVEELIEKLSAATVQTCAGKGVVSDKSKWNLGARLPFENIRQFIENSDVVIALGTQLSPTDLWENSLKFQGTLIQIDVDSDAFYRNAPADLGIKGDCTSVLQKMLPLLKEKNTTIPEELDQLKIDAVKSAPQVIGNEVTFDMAIDVLDVFREVLKDDEALVADMTTAAYIALSEYQTYQPRTFLHPVGFGTLGYSMPAAIGMKAAQPDKNLIALIGDGGFQFTMQELAVACEQELPIPIVIWNNAGYGEIKRNEKSMDFDSFIAVDNRNPDFMKLADAYGIEGQMPVNKKQLKEALLGSFAKKEPTIIEIDVNRWER
ncbi:5-guanidino-2-oxopentanoate decarboxylase [Alkalibacter rhizosphaerae]|uniref:5-guanidino-2-oxopentanoate decarboxylase n=1 Tax=Alkalibacter rhizosphaerae TaxID=2815577 RepID=A0A975AI75_9FIRM|nr:5-guanidino-2-oxopentanoate decarboxylase [Alkalibacter rhizosphaerae]QSX08245.1 5-guanidino-2-oxopentanoate decarboxylase [Alkalibacter rhizosphaerae]